LMCCNGRAGKTAQTSREGPWADCKNANWRCTKTKGLCTITVSRGTSPPPNSPTRPAKVAADSMKHNSKSDGPQCNRTPNAKASEGGDALPICKFGSKGLDSHQMLAPAKLSVSCKDVLHAVTCYRKQAIADPRTEPIANTRAAPKAIAHGGAEKGEEAIRFVESATASESCPAQLCPLLRVYVRHGLPPRLTKAVNDIRRHQCYRC